MGPASQDQAEFHSSTNPREQKGAADKLMHRDEKIVKTVVVTVTFEPLRSV